MRNRTCAIIPPCPTSTGSANFASRSPTRPKNFSGARTFVLKCTAKYSPSWTSQVTPITFKCAPEQFHDLLEIEGIFPAPYVGRYKWVLLESSDVLPSSALEALIRQSYELVVARAPKKKAKSKKQPSSGRER